MHDDEKRIDLSVLDPARDPERWDRLLSSLAVRAAQSHRERWSGRLVLVWSRPAFVLAAALALLVWGATFLLEAPRAPRPVSRPDPAVTLIEWVQLERPPTPTDILTTLGGTVDG
jgi:hypothetical protein